MILDPLLRETLFNNASNTTTGHDDIPYGAGYGGFRADDMVYMIVALAGIIITNACWGELFLQELPPSKVASTCEGNLLMRPQQYAFRPSGTRIR